MRMNRLLSLLVALIMVLSLCVGAVAEELKPYEEALALFPSKVDKDVEAIEGGVLRMAIVASNAFAGTLNPLYYQDDYDAQVLTWFAEGILSADEDFVFDQDGPATYVFDKDEKTMTLTLHEGIKWHDGEPVTLDDLVYAYEVICHADYEGFRYDDEQFPNIIGVDEYRAGEADTISGMVLSEDNMQLTIHFKEVSPSILVGGIWIHAIPRHYYGDLDVKEMENHEKTRETPIGFGPFKVKNIVPGEAVEFERYDDYWRGNPKLDGVVLTVVAPELVPTAMQEGQYDVSNFSTQDYPDYTDPTNYVYLGELQTVFNYTGFKLGTWDEAAKRNNYNPDSKMANVNLRQAIGYAVDMQTLSDTLYNGLRFPATTVITPRHASYQNTDIEGYYYNPELAKQLLDEAGYIDVDGDGFREDLSGEQLVITWASMDGQGADTIANFKIQCWNDVGLNVVLYQDRLTEFNAFYKAVEFDDPEIDMFDAAWSTGFDPTPSVLWGPKSTANYTRYTSDTFTKVMDEITSDAAWDPDFLLDKYHEFQQLFFEEAPAIPTQWRMNLVAVNDRVKYFDNVSIDIEATLHLIELCAEEPAK